MLSKKILCGVVAYTTLASGSIGSYAAGGLEPKNIPSVIVNNPLLSAGALTAVAAAILTYKILAKNYGCKIPLVESKDENVNVDVPLHQGLPEPEEGPIEKDKKEDPREDNVEPLYTEDALLNNQNSGFWAKKWQFVLGIGGIVVVAVAIIYLVRKYKEALRKERFTSCKDKWEKCCQNLRNDRIEIQGKRYNLRTVFKAIINLRRDEQGKEVFESYWNYVGDTLGKKEKVVYSDLVEKNNCSSDIVSSRGLAMALKGDNKGTISNLDEKERRLLELIEDLRKCYCKQLGLGDTKGTAENIVIVTNITFDRLCEAINMLSGVKVVINSEEYEGKDVYRVLFDFFGNDFYDKIKKKLDDMKQQGDYKTRAKKLISDAVETVYRILDGNLTAEDIESFNSKKEEYFKKQQEKAAYRGFLNLNLGLGF